LLLFGSHIWLVVTVLVGHILLAGRGLFGGCWQGYFSAGGQGFWATGGYTSQGVVGWGSGLLGLHVTGGGGWHIRTSRLLAGSRQGRQVAQGLPASAVVRLAQVGWALAGGLLLAVGVTRIRAFRLPLLGITATGWLLGVTRVRWLLLPMGSRHLWAAHGSGLLLYPYRGTSSAALLGSGVHLSHRWVSSLIRRGRLIVSVSLVAGAGTMGWDESTTALLVMTTSG